MPETTALGEQAKTWLIEQIAKIGPEEAASFYRHAQDSDVREAARVRLTHFIS